MSDLRRLAAGKGKPVCVPTAAARRPEEAALRLLLAATTGGQQAGQEPNNQVLKRLWADVCTNGALLTPCKAPPRSPVGVDVSCHTVALTSEGTPMRLDVGHAYGREHFASSAKGFYKRVHGTLLLCHAHEGSPENLEGLRNWHTVVHHTSNGQSSFVIVAVRPPAPTPTVEAGPAPSPAPAPSDEGGHWECKGGEAPCSDGRSPARLYRDTHLPTVPYFEIDSSEGLCLKGPLLHLLDSAMQAMQKGPIHPTPVTQTQGPLPKNRWTPERHKTYPKDFRDVAMLLLLNSQAHERRAPNPAARVPPVIWQQVLSFCTPLWFFTDRRLQAIKSERLEVRQTSIEDTMEGSSTRAKTGECLIS